MFLNNISNSLAILTWQNSSWKNDAEAKRNRPKPFVPDFMKKAPEGQVAMDIDDLKSILSKPRKAVD